ncbi:hypothetical protein HYU45_02205 [Candidatus Daviesbacteria bacterium]|nr:hypothetical protein [Candidatus Daviesbacteria bacterium]
MRETDRQIKELYLQYKAAKLQPEQQAQKPLPIIGRIAQLLRRQRRDLEGERRAVSEPERTRDQIKVLLRGRLGSYPLVRISHVVHGIESGFEYGFDYSLGEDVFAVDYWSYNRWGILVQKHPSDYTPKIEIVEEKIEPDKEFADENPELLGPYTMTHSLLHLPEGFRIPVGPLRFESDSLPISEEELAVDKGRAIAMIEAAEIKMNRDSLKMTEILEKLRRPARKYTDRFFFWQPILPDSPTKIAIDFDAINPYHMGLTLKNAPTFNNTVIIDDDL